ncbi:LysM peptidoglycan-binding domain-containing protein [Gracilibacillus caseinilyticus]|uniref:LysM peptidoglycan-binding domain-containing protein n=1 Tax=Gracilibacillus caseinilyticus TaxID=2932256 RepID=A0ABY4ETS7_9BACI|nr:LysM peptidoglycan-binding domain-containing protein [Gracilibacillus caseinilyticus]UOQ47277.1 LysM peptidoglycan-binding domain-containing protein [Gracilibacillus caseinilyticus]
MQEAFTFNIHEVVAFENEQQIKEMLGIGLEPVISMEELGNTLSIRGVMELKGEYIKSDTPDLRVEEPVNGNYVERVESLSDEVNEFFHKFLIDVSVPLDRIASLDDVFIEVDHFDYNLDAVNEMTIEATLAIHGLQEPQPEPAVEEEREFTEETELLAFEENRFDEQTEDAAETFHLEMDEEDLESTEEEEKEEEKVVPITSVRAMQEGEDQEIEDSHAQEDDVSAEEEDFEEEEEKLHVKTRNEPQDETSYLLNVFADEEASSYTRLKLYIVQPDDQIHTIAERYQLSSKHIMRVNRLEDEDVSAGQLIYIPVPTEE